MSLQDRRYIETSPSKVMEGWRLDRLTPPSRLFGANGIRAGADGRIYVAQVSGSTISAVDVDTGFVETISPKGGDIVAPDDLAFDEAGNLYATEITEGRVSMRTPNGETRVVYGDIPCANPITWHQGRLIAGECLPGGRIMELDLHGGAPRVIASDIPMPNAMEVGPDGKLYFPVMGANEIWRVDLSGGAPEKVVGDLGVPDSVKFDADGFIVSTQVASGQVLRIDPSTGDKTVLANVAPGLDNLTFVGRRLFVSSISGEITEVLSEGKLRQVVPEGFNWPLGLAMGEDGALFVADGPYCYTMSTDGARRLAGMLFTPGSPGYVRGVAASGSGAYIVTTANGQVSNWRPAEQAHDVLAAGYDRLYGVAVAPDGAIVFAEAGAGRVHALKGGNVEVLASGLNEPTGVAITPDGDCLVAEEGAGRIVKASGGRVETVLDGLRQPQGLLVLGDTLYVVDAGAKQVLAYNMKSKEIRILASDLPLGAPVGVTPKFLKAMLPLSGPMGPFAGIAAGANGALYVSGDAEGSILALHPA